jgi:hypothetical protein
MRTALIALGLGLLGPVTSASAASLLYSTSTTNLTNMTHQQAYTWQLEGGFNIGANTITSAVLTFNGFFNWTSATSDPANILWLDLLDTSTHTGNGTVASATDDTNTGTLTINDVLDGFRYGPTGTNVSVVAPLVGSASRVYLGSSTNAYDLGVQGYNSAGGALGTNTGAFGTTPTNWSLTITDSTVLSALTAYIANGNNIAIGLDSDCHFGDTSIGFQIYGSPITTQATVPEPGTMLLVGSGLFAAYRRRRRKPIA